MMSCMIDWLKLRVPYTGTLAAGRVMSFDPSGAVEWVTEKRLPVVGSHDARIHVRRDPRLAMLEIDGNPSKFLQGHNVFGSDDLEALARAMIAATWRTIGHEPTEGELQCVESGCVEVLRVDVNCGWDLGTTARALTVIQAIGQLSSMRHRGLGSTQHEGTVYFRQHSRRVACKFYAKGHELLAHALAARIEHYDDLVAYAAGLVRFEVCFRRMHLLDAGLSTLLDWRRVTPRALLEEQLARVNISDATMRDAKALEGLPPRLQAAYQLWLDGHDLRRTYPRRTFYRHRAALLAFDVDIAVKRPREESNVIPLRIVLQGKPAVVPDWAKGTALLFDATARAA